VPVAKAKAEEDPVAAPPPAAASPAPPLRVARVRR
jgi:hypothetical protein